jgi:hypothetical protein
VQGTSVQVFTSGMEEVEITLGVLDLGQDPAAEAT